MVAPSANGRTARQRGYVNLDGIVPILLIAGALIGIVVYKLIAWLWSMLKAVIHSVTA